MKKKEPKRDFKGVWIPKQIWLKDNINITERAFLAEIDSLDNEDGCFASNDHFSKWSGLTKQRCSQIIKDLEEKKLIKIIYKYEKKKIKKRIIKIVGGIKNTLYPIKDSLYPIKNPLGGYQEYAKDINTINSNTINNTTNKEDEKIFSVTDKQISFLFRGILGKNPVGMDIENCKNVITKYGYKEVQTAFREAWRQDKKSWAYIEKILQNRKAKAAGDAGRKKLEQEKQKALKDMKNLEKTLWDENTIKAFRNFGKPDKKQPEKKPEEKPKTGDLLEEKRRKQAFEDALKQEEHNKNGSQTQTGSD